MTVQELIDKLQAMPDKTLEVWLADNDCCEMKATDARVVPLLVHAFCPGEEPFPDHSGWDTPESCIVVGQAVYIDN